MQYCKKIFNLSEKSALALGILLCFSLFIVSCSPSKAAMDSSTDHQKRVLAFQMLTAAHVTIIERGNQVDVLIPTDALFQTHSTNMTSSASSILMPLYRAIKTYDIETVQVQGIMPLNLGHDEKLLTLARAGVVGHDLWLDGLDSEVPIVSGSLRPDDSSSFSDITKNLRAPLMWVHWSYELTPRMYD